MNITSSRSHTVLFIRVEQNMTNGNGTGNGRGEKVHATLALVDLAGSERIRRTGSTGIALNEVRDLEERV